MAQAVVKPQKGKAALMVVDMMDREWPSSRQQLANRVVTDRVCRAVQTAKEVGLPTVLIGYGELEISPAVKIAAGRGATIIYKFTWNAFDASEVRGWIEESMIRVLFLCGYEKSRCVRATARDALRRNLEVVTSVSMMLSADDTTAAQRAGSTRFYCRNTRHLSSAEEFIEELRGHETR